MVQGARWGWGPEFAQMDLDTQSELRPGCVCERERERERVRDSGVHLNRMPKQQL